MERHFQHSYSVRYDECDLYGHLTPAAALRYMQDIAGLDSDNADVFEGGTWVARRTVLTFAAPVVVRTVLNIDTFPVGFTKITAQRAYQATLAGADQPAFAARTLWVYLDGSGKPARLPDSYHRFWLPDGSRPQLKEAAWPVFPTRPPHITTAPVRFSNLDVYGHMNNAAYVEALDDAGWQAVRQPTSPQAALVPQHFDIEYLESAQDGDVLTIQTWFEPATPQAAAFDRLQFIYRGDTIITRAVSRWAWQALS